MTFDKRLILVFLCCISSLPQIFIFKLFGFNLSLNTISLFFILLISIGNIDIPSQYKKIVVPLFFLALISLLSIAWSIDAISGIRYVIYLVFFIALLLNLINLYDKKYQSFISFLKILIFSGAFHALIITLFRLNPSIELEFLSSSAARLFIPSNSLEEFFANKSNNVLDYNKAGGFFINGNTAGAFSGMLGVLAFGLADQFKWRIGYLFGVACFFGVLASGSKASIIFLMLYLLVYVFRIRTNITMLYIGRGLIVASLIAVLTLYIYNRFPNTFSVFSDDSFETLGVRSQIWGFALDSFYKSPILGIGFGGWEKYFPEYISGSGLKETFPPHNTLLAIWAQSGLLSAIFAFGFLLIYLFAGFKRYLSSRNAIVFSSLFAAAWLSIQGMGENWGLFGDVHQQIVFAFCIVFTFSFPHHKSI